MKVFYHKITQLGEFHNYLPNGIGKVLKNKNSLFQGKLSQGVFNGTKEDLITAGVISNHSNIFYSYGSLGDKIQPGAAPPSQYR